MSISDETGWPAHCSVDVRDPTVDDVDVLPMNSMQLANLPLPFPRLGRLGGGDLFDLRRSILSFVKQLSCVCPLPPQKSQVRDESDCSTGDLLFLSGFTTVVLDDDVGRSVELDVDLTGDVVGVGWALITLENLGGVALGPWSNVTAP